MAQSECEPFIKNNDLMGLVDWLNENERNVGCFNAFLTENVNKSAEFVCEHSYFVYTGKVKQGLNLFKDEDMNLVAASLGTQSVYSDGRMSDLKDEFVEVKSYKRAHDFMRIYDLCCQKVDEEAAFSSIMQIMNCCGDDFGQLIKILGNVINSAEKGSASLITNSLVSILGYIEENKTIQLCPVLEFLELLWNKKDEHDTHSVGVSSLKDFSTKLILKMKLEEVKVSDMRISADESYLMLANLVCKNQQNIYNWVCGLSLRQSAPVSGVLDSFALNDAVCIYLLLASNKSLIPKVYSFKSMGLMLFKLSHVFLSNLNDERSKPMLAKMVMESSELALKYIECANLLNQSKVIDDSHMFPWHPVGYLSGLLNENESTLDTHRVTNVFKGVLDSSVFSIKVQILKSVMKSVSSEFGISLCLMESKDLCIEWEEKGEEGLDYQIDFVKYILNAYFDITLASSMEDTMYDSLSILLNWIKYLLLSNNKLTFRKIVKNNYLDSIKKMYNNLNEEIVEISKNSHNTHIDGIFLNKLNLIKFLMTDVFVLIDKDD